MESDQETIAATHFYSCPIMHLGDFYLSFSIQKKKNQIQYSGVLISISLKKLKQDHFNSVEQI